VIGYAALARGRQDFSPLRGISYIVGVVILWVALETPIDTLSDHYLQSVHMFQHVLLGILAPPLLLLGAQRERPRNLALGGEGARPGRIYVGQPGRFPRGNAAQPASIGTSGAVAFKGRTPPSLTNPLTGVAMRTGRMREMTTHIAAHSYREILKLSNFTNELQRLRASVHDSPLPRSAHRRPGRGRCSTHRARSGAPS